MRRCVVAGVTVLVLVLGSSLVAQLPTHDGPIVKLDEGYEAVDRGRASVGTLVRRRVPITSLASGRVELRVVGTSCPCTQAQVESATLGAGESTVLELATTAADVPNPQYYTATLEVIERDDANRVLRTERRTTGIGYAPDTGLIVGPRTAVISLAAGETREFDVVLRRPDRLNLQVDAVECPGPWIRLKSTNTEPNQPWQATLRLEVSGERADHLVGEVRFLAAGAAPSAGGRLKVIARVQTPISVSPAGAVLVERPGDAEHRVVLALKPGREWQPEFMKVELDDGAPVAISLPKSVQLASDAQITVSARWSDMPKDSGSCEARCVAGGKVVATFPVVWIRHVP